VVPLIGYLDRFSARPGERIAVKVSSQLDRPYRADLVRIIHADANPAGPGIKLEDGTRSFYRHLPVPLPAGPSRIMLRGHARQSPRLARSLHDRRSRPTLAARRATAARSGGALRFPTVNWRVK
jgi:hypothetical protein